MSTQILRMKLHIPVGRQPLISRPQLIDRLNSGLEHKLTLVSAPAGSGKTCLIRSWSQVCGRPFAWLSLDQQDDEPITFLTYLGSALQTVHPDLKAALTPAIQTLVNSSADPPDIQRFVTALLNTVAEIHTPLVLVLDDFHEIRAVADRYFLTFFLDYLPANMHLVIITREDPPLPLARLRGHQELVEIRATDLRFSRSEIGNFLHQVMGVELTAEEIGLLEERTEGWVAGIQMVALALRNREDTAPFVQSFAREDRYVMDYLMDEVLAQQPLPVQHFLVHTSILARMCSSLCDALLQGHSVFEQSQTSQDILDSLEQSNLFIVPLDGQRNWYRYHHLFAELLRQRLRRNMADQIPELHRRASVWYEKNGLPIQAMHHALANDDLERVVYLIEKNVLGIAYSGELATLLAWMRSVPVDVVRSRPLLCAAHGWAFAHAGQLQTAETYLRDAEAALDTDTTGNDDYVRGQIAAIRAYAAALAGEMARAVERTQHALQYLSQGDAAYGFTQLLQASALGWSGQLKAATDAYDAAQAASLATDNIGIRVDCLCDIARLHTWQGHLHTAAEFCRQAIEISTEDLQQGGQQSPESGYAYLRLSAILREWNDRDAALSAADKGIDICAKWGQANILTHCYFELAQVRQMAGDDKGALAAIHIANSLAESLSPWFVHRAQAWEARLHLMQGDLQSALEWQGAHTPAPDTPLHFESIDNYLTAARILLAQGYQQGARLPEPLCALLDRLAAMAEETGATGYLIEALTLQALAAWIDRNTDHAVVLLEKALTLARPEGYKRLFVDLGEPIIELFHAAVERGIEPDYCAELLAILNKETAYSPPELVEALSTREQEVLRLLAIGRSNKAIADQLVVTVGTIKTHINHIYGKLGVHSRTQAVARAKEIHIL